MPPKVSVIVPIYNVEKYITRCACSLFEQTLKEIEFIFVNDGTPDKSIDLLQECINHYPLRASQVRIITHEHNKGLPAARNTGLREATGEYIFHCDSDDFIENNMLQCMYHSAIEHNADLVYCDFFITYENNDRKMSNPSYDNIESFVSEGLLGGRTKYNVWNKIIKRSVYIDNHISFPSGHAMGEDMTIICAASCCNTVSHVKEAFYHYIRTNVSAYSYTITDKQVDDIVFNTNRTISFLKNNPHNEYDEQIELFKLNTKLPFLFSDNISQYSIWQSLWPESNKFIMRNKLQPIRTKFIQWLAYRHLFILVWLYYVIIYKIVYNLIYR